MLPIALEPRQAGLAGEELLHGGLLDGPLLGDQLLQRADQCIHIGQRSRDGALFGSWREGDFGLPDLLETDLGIRLTCRD